jgi:hypothetical protein
MIILQRNIGTIRPTPRRDTCWWMAADTGAETAAAAVGFLVATPIVKGLAEVDATGAEDGRAVVGFPRDRLSPLATAAAVEVGSNDDDDDDDDDEVAVALEAEVDATALVPLARARLCLLLLLLLLLLALGTRTLVYLVTMTV